jgi:hypothetical protein
MAVRAALVGLMAVRTALAIGLLAGTLALATEVRAAFEVVVSASPSEVQVGEPLEVLIRTFIPVQRNILDVGEPREPYPAPSGLWNVLYPTEDYPFDVVAEHEGGSEVAVTVVRDPSDSTLWRGIVSLPSAGTWTIRVRNFTAGAPGATTVVHARAGTPVFIQTGLAAAAALGLGLLAGVFVGRRWRRSRT